jgi:hypothetical protein
MECSHYRCYYPDDSITMTSTAQSCDDFCGGLDLHCVDYTDTGDLLYTETGYAHYTEGVSKSIGLCDEVPPDEWVGETFVEQYCACGDAMPDWYR